MEKVAIKTGEHKSFGIPLGYAQIDTRIYTKNLIKIVLITKGIAELLRDNEHEVTVFRWSNWGKLLPRELYCSHKIRTLWILTDEKGQMKV